MRTPTASAIKHQGNCKRYTNEMNVRLKVRGSALFIVSSKSLERGRQTSRGTSLSRLKHTHPSKTAKKRFKHSCLFRIGDAHPATIRAPAKEVAINVPTTPRKISRAVWLKNT